MAPITVVSQNMSHSGLYHSNGTPDPDRWDGLMHTIAQHRPDVLLLQEVGRWSGHNRQPIARAERDLGLRMVGIVTVSANGGTAVMINPATVGWEEWEDRYSGELHHGFGVAVLRLPDLATPLAVISAHLTPYSAAAAAQEAQVLIARAYRYGGVGIIGGDINHFPLDSHAIPDPDTIPPYNRSSRWIREQDGTYSPNRIVARTLATGGLSDAAALVAQRAGDTSLLGATGRGRCRVDQFWLTPPLTPAVVDYQAHAHEFSDHHLVLTRLDPARVDLNAALPEWI
ncbi:endonuclease/exonuclease/phosphatase family protein [Nocardiopsis metallicus]|uniref:Exonuclease III n=1 Tax=Nocardiopsis metallicus TaxID=179819 RepID=A0A840WT71_9ACTN|nr:endonuclease/exonuclease/phosphatase family protein [Nocardiopsis metallicus]MBB5494757.1 exonuclease III [Nocardiopsis metallicus]